MAEKLGVPQSIYMHYELLGTSAGREPMIFKIADILEVSIDYLFGREEL